MAKSKKDKVKNKALSSGSLDTHLAVKSFFNAGKAADIDETLMKAGIQRHRLADGKATLLIQNTETQEVTKPKKVRASAPLGTTYTGGVFSNAKLDDMPSL